MASPRLLHSLLVPLDRAAEATLQAQVREGIRGAIAKGALVPGARLPSVRTLTTALRVSRTTVALALQELIEEGLLVTRERSGTFVASQVQRRPPSPASEGMRTGAVLRLSRRGEELARSAQRFPDRPRPRAFRLSRPALELFPIREWNRLLAKRAARLTVAQLDYDQESPRLCAAIAELVSAARGIPIHPSQVMLFAGSQRALEFAATCLLEPGDQAWMEEPGYPGARQVLRSVGAQVVAVPVDEGGLSVHAGERLAPRARLAYVTPSNQFPLGVAMDLPRRRELLRWADAADACVVEDDYDVEFSEQGGALPALFALDGSARVLYVGSFSRSLFPASRLGYLIAPGALAETLRAARSTLEEQLPSLLQLTLADFISEGLFARHVRKMRTVYTARRVALVEAVRATDLLPLQGEPQGLHAVVGLPAGVDPRRVASLAALQRLEARPLSDFCVGAPRPALVLGFGAVRAEEIGPAVETLAGIVESELGAGKRRRR